MIPEKTRLDLDWDRLVAALADRCSGPMGARAAAALELAHDEAGMRQRLAESAEAVRLFDAGEPLPITHLEDAAEAVQRLAVGGALGAAELRVLSGLLVASRVLRRFLATRRERCPALYTVCSTDPTLDELAQELEEAFDADGTLSDRASPRLCELRGQVQAARRRILARLDDLMRKYDNVVQDRFVTEREGRYVVPVRSDAHDRFPGLVHATSGSGATLFVEPRAVISMGNRLKVLATEVEREENLVYARLSSLLADSLPSIQGAAAAIARADVLAATARLAHELKLTFPVVPREPRLVLTTARHPLLALALPHVVPSDLEIEAGHAVVVSGPNAGGKTVALKTMGLCALMTRAGLPIPCAENSEVGFFEIVLTDVGDDQSLAKSLSTFSAHVANLRSILEETRPRALVLLDELAGGTDPREGEALAAGVLDSLCARGGAVVATTHYEGLKALAANDPRFKNASVGFDLSTMEPTFRLAMGVPGRSSALAVARRYGLPSTVIERAERFLSRDDQDFETTVARLNDERAALELARNAAESERQRLVEKREELESEISHARDREQRAVTREAESLMASVRRAKEELRAAQARLRAKKVEADDVRDASRAIDRVAGRLALGGELEHLVMPPDQVRPALRAETLRRGDKVYVPRLRAEAEVIEVHPGGVRVAAGPLKMNVTLEELREAAAAAKPVKSKRETARREPRPSTTEPAIQTHDNTCDLRGMRVDEAVAMATGFLDRSINEHRSVAFLVHGHGTGALRDAIRKELKASPYVAFSRSGTHEEGGEGVTVVWLA